MDGAGAWAHMLTAFAPTSVGLQTCSMLECQFRYVVQSCGAYWGVAVAKFVRPTCHAASSQGYDMYIRVFYVHVAIIFVILACVGWLTLAMRKMEQSKSLKKAAKFLQVSKSRGHTQHKSSSSSTSSRCM